MTTTTTPGPINPDDDDALAAALAANARKRAKADAKAKKDHTTIATHHAKLAGLTVGPKGDNGDSAGNGGTTVFKSKVFKAVLVGSNVIVTEKATGTTRTVTMEQWTAAGMDPATVMSGNPLDTPSDTVTVVNGLGNEVKIPRTEFDANKSHYAEVLSDGQLRLPNGTVKPRHKFRPRDLGPGGIVGFLRTR